MQEAPTIHFKTNEVIIHEGEPSNSIFLIVSGKVKITKDTGSKPLLLATQGKNTIFGEMTLIDGQRRSATVTATEDTFCYKCNTMALVEQLNKIDIDLLFALKSLVAIIRKNNLKLISGQKNEQKNNEYLPDIEIPTPEREEKALFSLEKIKEPEIQKKINSVESPFIKSLFRILTKTATTSSR